MAGIEAALRAGADVIVYTDGDNQYDSSCIPDLVTPIVEQLGCTHGQYDKYS